MLTVGLGSGEIEAYEIREEKGISRGIPCTIADCHGIG